jgi:hypothetical protein
VKELEGLGLVLLRKRTRTAFDEHIGDLSEDGLHYQESYTLNGEKVS